MEPVSIKFEENFLRAIERIMKKHNYMTKSEFIREAVREKIKEIEKEERIKKIDELFGSSKHKTTDKDLHKARERLEKLYDKKFK